MILDKMIRKMRRQEPIFGLGQDKWFVGFLFLCYFGPVVQYSSGTILYGEREMWEFWSEMRRLTAESSPFLFYLCLLGEVAIITFSIHQFLTYEARNRPG
jgi:hypothetical protein